MADDRPPWNRTPDTGSGEYYRECAAALRTLKATRGVLMFVLFLALLAPLAAFVAVYQFDVLQLRPTQDVAFTPMPDAVSPRTAAVIERGLPIAAFVGRASTVLLLACFVLAAQVSLAGRIPGVAGFASAAVWAGLALVLMGPWREWTNAPALWSPFPGSSEIYQTTIEAPTTPADQVLAWVRFAGLPLIALLTVWAGWLRFSAGDAAARRFCLGRAELRHA